MFTSSASITTEQGQRLITRLGRHWGHKFAVDLEDNHLPVPFDADTLATMAVQPHALAVQIHTPDASRLEPLQKVVADHLQRFAKEQTLSFHWQQG